MKFSGLATLIIFGALWTQWACAEKKPRALSVPRKATAFHKPRFCGSADSGDSLPNDGEILLGGTLAAHDERSGDLTAQITFFTLSTGRSAIFGATKTKTIQLEANALVLSSTGETLAVDALKQGPLFGLLAVMTERAAF